MFHTNISMKKAITLELGSGGLWFAYSTLSLIKIHLPIKFHADIFCSNWDMFHTNKSMNNLSMTALHPKSKGIRVVFKKSRGKYGSGTKH